MLTLILTVAVLGLLCLLIGAALAARRTVPAPASGWRDGDVLSRRAPSAVDAALIHGYSSGELFIAADEAREPGSRGDVRLFTDLAFRQAVVERLHDERETHRLMQRTVRATVRVAL